jgi:hypothetical protein
LYIVRKSLKNSLKELLKKPGKLALYLVIIALLGVQLVVSLFTKAQADQPAPLFWFSGIMFLLGAMFMVLTGLQSLGGGSAIFDMNDVNLAFVSPINPRKTLLYGLIRLAKTSFIASFFILFQATSLALFGIGYGGVLLTFGGFTLSMATLTVSSLLIYSVTNGKPRRKLAVKLSLGLFFAPLAVYFAAQYLSGRDIAAAVQAAVASPWFRFVPVAGWTASGITALLSGEILPGCGFLGLNLLLAGAAAACILLSNPDYYEDVLVATETAYEKKRAIAEGNLLAAAGSKKAVRLSKTGIPGSGAAALFGKHMRESFRENRFGILTLPSVLIAAGAIVFALFIRELFVVLQTLMWVQIMFIGTGRGLKELYSHYIYLIPESSFKKILWSNMEIMARTLLESALIFGIGGALTGAGPAYILVCFLTYALFSLLLLGVNYLLMRFTGADVSAGLLLIIYYLAVILAMLPGVALAILVGIVIGGDSGYLAGLLILAGWELAAGLGCFALSRGVLHNCDMATMVKMNPK